MGIFECWLHFAIAANVAIYTILQIVFHIVFSSRPKEVDEKATNKFDRWIKKQPNAYIAFTINLFVHFLSICSFIAIPHCWLCTILIILDFLWTCVTVCVIFFRARIVDFFLKKAKQMKKSKRKTKWITRLTKWKNEIEFDNNAITLNDAFNLASVLNPKKSFNVKKLNDIVQKFEKCSIKQDQNIGGNKMIQDCWTYFVSISGDKGKEIKSQFAYVFDLRKNDGKDKAAVLLLKIEPKETNEIFKLFPSATVSKFPFGREFIAFPLTDFISIETCEIYLKKAYDYTFARLEEKELDKSSKKLRV